MTKDDSTSNGDGFWSKLRLDPLLLAYFNEYLVQACFHERLRFVVLEDELTVSSDPRKEASHKDQNTAQTSKWVISVQQSRSLQQWLWQNRVRFFLNSKQHRLHKFAAALQKIQPFCQPVCQPVGLPDVSGRGQPSKSNLEASTSRVSTSNADLDSHSKCVSAPAIRTVTLGVAERNFSLPTAFADDVVVFPNICKRSDYQIRYLKTDQSGEGNFCHTAAAIDSGRSSVLEFDNNTNSALWDGDKALDDDVPIDVDQMHLPPSTLQFSFQDMSQFNGFLLSHAAAADMLMFWMKAEDYLEKANSSTPVYGSLKQYRTKVLRLIQEKFHLHMTSNAKELLPSAVHCEKDAQDFLKQAQLDIIHKIRTYWLPMFLLHTYREKEPSYAVESDIHRRRTSVFPAVSVVRWLPLCADEEDREKPANCYWELRNPQWRLKTGRCDMPSACTKQLDDDMLKALNLEAASGHPFWSWLSRKKLKTEEWCLSLWLDVNELLADFEIMRDRLLTLCSAWKVFHKYFEAGSDILPAREIERMRACLASSEQVSPGLVQIVFSKAQDEVVRILRSYWEIFCSEQTEELNRSVASTSSPILEVEDVEFASACDDEQKEEEEADEENGTQPHKGSGKKYRDTKLVQGSFSRTSTEGARKVSTDVTSFTEHASTDAVSPQKRGDVKNQSNQAHSPSSSRSSISTSEDQYDFLDNVNNHELMTSLKSFIHQEEGRGLMNQFNLYLDIENYMSIPPQKKLQKEQMAMMIHKTYMDASSRRVVELPSHVLDGTRKGRPSSSFLRDVQHHILPSLDDAFQRFNNICKLRLPKINGSSLNIGLPGDMPGMKNGSIVTVSHVNTFVKKSKRKVKGTAPMAKEDLDRFLDVVSSHQTRESEELLNLFRRYLFQFCDVDNPPKLEKNLQFYLEVERLKNLRSCVDEESLCRKVEVIVDVFLDSASPPWVQIDVSAEIATRAVQKASASYSMASCSHGPPRDCKLFDEAQSSVLKTLLPYWSGFLSSFTGKSERKIKTARFLKFQRSRYEKFLRLPDLCIPVTVDAADCEDSGVRRCQLNFSISGGVKWQTTVDEVPSD